VGQAKVEFGNTEGAYAISSDFCRIFNDDMNELVRLAYLLTGDVERAEQCFVAGLEDCSGSNRVFREWAQSWARRAVIQNAIRLVDPSRNAGGRLNAGSRVDESVLNGENAKLAPILGLNSLERFVFVLSVLEKYSDQDCATLLGRSRRDIVAARSQAMKHFARLSGALPATHAEKDSGLSFFPRTLFANSA
jgi:DNA-directed RNA polymerase specialized sigma24 family protein